MIFQREVRMMTMRKRKRMRIMIMMLSSEKFQRMRTMRRRRTMRMMPNMSTPTPSLTNIGLEANRLNRMNKSPP